MANGNTSKSGIKKDLGDLKDDAVDFLGILGDLVTKPVPDPFGWRSDPVGAFQSGVDDIENFLGRQADALKVKGQGTQNVEAARNRPLRGLPTDTPMPATPAGPSRVDPKIANMDRLIQQQVAQNAINPTAGNYRFQGRQTSAPPSYNRVDVRRQQTAPSAFGGGSGRTIPAYADRRTDSASAAAAQLAAKRAAEQNALFAQGARGAQAARQASPELDAIADIATTTAVDAVASGDPFAAADAAGTDIRGRDLSYLQTPDENDVLPNADFLTAWDAAIKETLGDTSGMSAVEAAEAYETASAQRALDAEIINQDVFDALEVQIATDEGGNINAPIFQWGVTESGADQIVMAPTTVDPAEQCALDGGTWNGTSCDLGGGETKTAEQLCIDQGGTWDGTSCKIGGDPDITVPPEDQLTYEDKQKKLSTDTYNKRVAEIEQAVKDGLIDIQDAQTAFNDAKDQLFADMAALNKITYDEVNETFSFNTQQRAADVQSMLDLLATQGVEQNLIQDVIGGDIGMNLAGYGEETDAMRDFSEMLNIIGQQGSGEAEMLGNYMFDSYRQDLETTGRNMELQSAMQMLAEQQAAAEQNLQSSMLGPYFGIDPALMMAGMGAGVDVAGVAENRAIQEQAATDAMDLLLAQQKFATDERVAGETFTGGQNYQNNLWDYVTDQTMNPYQSGMLKVAEDEQRMDMLSSLMQMMQPSEAAIEAQAQTDYDNNLAAAIMEMQRGYMPETWSGANSFTPSMMTSPATTALDRMTPEMISALEQSDFDMGNYLVDQAREEQEMFATYSLADAIGMDPMQLIGASQAGILDKLISEYDFEMTESGFTATASDPAMEFPYPPTEMNPSGSVGMVDLSEYKDMLDIYYPGWDGPPEERTFEMMTPSGQTVTVGAEYENVKEFIDAMMAGGYTQEDIFNMVSLMMPAGTATGG